MYNLPIIGKLIRCFSSINNINKMDLYIGIKVHFYFHLVFYLDQKYLNVLKNVLFAENWAVNQRIKLNKSVII